MSLYSRLDRLAADVEKLNRQVTAVANSPQSQRTSVEGGSIDFNDADGNLMAIMGGQDDGSNTIRHVDGPTPPVPSGLSAHVDGPIVQVSWDGTFEDADTATYDWSHLEVIAVGPNSENLRATINDVTGATANLAATVSGEWVVVARSVSRAEKRSLDGDAGTVEVKLVDIDGAIDAVQDSANGKNKVTYSDRPPTPADPGIFDDTWFVGQVGRPNDVVEATNFAKNPTFTSLLRPMGAGENMSSGGGAALSVDSSWSAFGDTSLKIGPGSSTASSAYVRNNQTDSPDGDWAGKTVTVSATIRLTEPMTGATDTSGERSIAVGYRTASGGTVWVHARSNVAPNSAGVTRCVVTTTLPSSDMSNWFIRLFNGSTTVPVWWDGLSVVEASAASTYFDGDTPSGATDNEPHYRWTGEPHASTSEKYLPALNIGDSDNWNIIEQYRHDGTGWVKVELSHHVFSTVDLGKATVGELDGIRIMGQTIRGEQLSGDAIDGKVITGGTYRTTGGTGSWSDDGLFIAQPDGTSMVRFPTDGSPLSLTASDVQIDRASITDLDLSYGAVRSGGQLTLASGVTAPASPPELTTGWNKVCTLDRPASPDSTTRHLAYWAAGSGHWLRAVDVRGVAGDTQDCIEVYSATTGARENTILVGLNPRNGITVMGDIVYVFGVEHGSNPRDFIDGYNLNTGERTSRHVYTRNIQAQNALGNDGTNLLIASVYNTELWVHRRDPVTGVQVGPDMRSGSNTWSAYANNNHLYGVFISGTELTVVPRQTARVYTIDGGTLTRKTDTANPSGFAGWNNPNKNGDGMVWRPGSLGPNVPFIVDGAGDVYEGTQFSRDTNVSACFTWFNGTNETTPSPMLVSSFRARSNPRFSMPARAGMQKRLYFNFGSWNYVTLPEDMTTFSWMDVLDHGLTTGAPPTTNTFPNADPATLKSTNNTFEVNGDGSGHWGPLTFNADGTMSSSQVPAWVPITSFSSIPSDEGGGTYGPQTWGDVPSYRIWPDGKVEWRGVIAGNFNGTTVASRPLFTIPAEARPGRPKNKSAAASGSTPVRVEFGPTVDPTKFYAYPSGGSRSWVSIDELFYYLP